MYLGCIDPIAGWCSSGSWVRSGSLLSRSGLVWARIGGWVGGYLRLLSAGCSSFVVGVCLLMLRIEVVGVAIFVDCRMLFIVVMSILIL